MSARSGFVGQRAAGVELGGRLASPRVEVDFGEIGRRASAVIGDAHRHLVLRPDRERCDQADAPLVDAVLHEPATHRAGAASCERGGAAVILDLDRTDHADTVALASRLANGSVKWKLVVCPGVLSAQMRPS